MSTELSGVPDVVNHLCPSRKTLELLADKWVMVTIVSLSRSDKRTHELMRSIGNITHKVMTQTLRNLELNGLVYREVYAEVPPRVVYSLTPLGQTLVPAIQLLSEWAQNHYSDVLTAREQNKPLPDESPE
jgi:DNA-binding HxlR family transcriptional regulator